jgi:hypothetical protein
VAKVAWRRAQRAAGAGSSVALGQQRPDDLAEALTIEGSHTAQVGLEAWIALAEIVQPGRQINEVQQPVIETGASGEIAGPAAHVIEVRHEFDLNSCRP